MRAGPYGQWIVGVLSLRSSFLRTAERAERGIRLIHQFINNGIAIVMDINSGSVHVADPVFYEAVAAAEPLVGELEKPEPLKENLSGWWSRRIDETNRIVYRAIDEETIAIASCKHHY